MVLSVLVSIDPVITRVERTRSDLCRPVKVGRDPFGTSRMSATRLVRRLSQRRGCGLRILKEPNLNSDVKVGLSELFDASGNEEPGGVAARGRSCGIAGGWMWICGSWIGTGGVACIDPGGAAVDCCSAGGGVVRGGSADNLARCKLSIVIERDRKMKVQKRKSVQRRYPFHTMKRCDGGR